MESTSKIQVNVITMQSEYVHIPCYFNGNFELSPTKYSLYLYTHKYMLNIEHLLKRVNCYT